MCLKKRSKGVKSGLVIILISLAALFFPQDTQAQAATRLVDLGVPREVLVALHDNSVMRTGAMPAVEEMTTETVANFAVFSLANRTSAGSTTNAVVASFVASYADISQEQAVIAAGETLTPSASLSPLAQLMSLVQLAKNATTIDLTGMLSQVPAGSDPFIHLRILALADFTKLPALKELALGSNHIGQDAGVNTEGNTSFFFERVLNITQLAALDLSNNELVTLNLYNQNPEGISKIREQVDFSGNPELLSTVDFNDVKQINVLQALYTAVNNNPGKVKLSDKVVQGLVSIAVKSTSMSMNQQALTALVTQMSPQNIMELVEHDAGTWGENKLPGYGYGAESNAGFMGSETTHTSTFIPELLKHPELLSLLATTKASHGNYDSLMAVFVKVAALFGVKVENVTVPDVEIPDPTPPQTDGEDQGQSEVVIQVTPATNPLKFSSAPEAFNFQTGLVASRHYQVVGGPLPGDTKLKIQSFEPSKKWQVMVQPHQEMAIYRDGEEFSSHPQLEALQINGKSFGLAAGQDNVLFTESSASSVVNETYNYELSAKSVALTFYDASGSLQVDDVVEGIIEFNLVATPEVK